MIADEAEQLVDEIVTLPTVPSVLHHVNSLLNEPETPMSKVAEAVSADPSISMKVLRLVNSAYFGLGQEVGTVQQALPLLGLKIVRNVVITATVFEAFGSDKTKGGKKPLLNVKKFWQHSGCCAVVAQCIASRAGQTGSVDKDELFMGGLLHDIGKVIIDQYLRDKMGDAVSQGAGRTVPWRIVEKGALGFTHAELGGVLASKWKLPEVLVEMIVLHHNPSETVPPSVPAAIVGVADYISHVMTESEKFDERAAPFPSGAWKLTGLQNRELPEIIGDVGENLSELNSFLVAMG